MISDADLLLLSQSGYLSIYATAPASFIFPELVQEHFAEKGALQETQGERMSDTVVRMDIAQICVWLIAPLIAVLFFLFLLWLIVLQTLQRHFSASIAAAIADLKSACLPRLCPNWDKANQHWSYLCLRLPAIKSQEINK